MYVKKWSLMVFAVGILFFSGSIVAEVARAQESTPATQESFPVNIRFLNAMTAVDNVDVYINGDDSDQRVVEGLTYGDVSDPFEGTAPATGILVKRNVEFGIDQYLHNVVIPTEAGKEYLVVISDLLIIPTELDLSPLVADAARARVVHAASQAPSLDIYAARSGEGLALGNLVPIIKDIQFGQVTDGGRIPAGSYDVQGVAAGTTTVAVEASAMAIESGQVYVVVVIGDPGDTDTPLTFVPVFVPAE